MISLTATTTTPSPAAATTSKYSLISNAEISEEIRNEINRFESVHPSIYTIYDLIQLINNENIQNQIRQQVVNIEDAFVNSQEWTMSRSVTNLKLGLIGSLNSGKTSLVHRYLTGACTSEESPEGGRFKKEVVIDGHSYLLLIRDEGSNCLPDYQFAHWVDGLMLVFSVESQDSIMILFNYFNQIAEYRDIRDIPIILVGTQDSVSEKNPRMISEQEGWQMLRNLSDSASYIETCSMYGLNVDRVFKDACQRIINHRARLSSATPISLIQARRQSTVPPAVLPRSTLYPRNENSNNNNNQCSTSVPHSSFPSVNTVNPTTPLSHRNSQNTKSQRLSHYEFCTPSPAHSTSSIASVTSVAALHGIFPPKEAHEYIKNDDVRFYVREDACSDQTVQLVNFPASANHLSTPLSTPNLTRKNKRISNLFRTAKDSDVHKDINLGVGRAIPVKQGHMYKRSSKTLNKEWKKKYVCLYSDGRLSYYNNLKDYMDKESASKEINLGLATVRIIGQQRPRHMQQPSSAKLSFDHEMVDNVTIKQVDYYNIDKNILSTINNYVKSDLSVRKGDEKSKSTDGPTVGGGVDEQQAFPQRPSSASATPVAFSKKKKSHRKGSSSARNNDDDDDCEFEVLTCDEKRWEFSAVSINERDQWVAMIEQIIEKTLQSQMSEKELKNNRIRSNRTDIYALKDIPGNDACADCGSERPVWASLNIGALICIQCSGVHRNLGSHISKVRSLDLDDWLAEWVSVMEAIGNARVNSIWEYSAPLNIKPRPNSPYEEKERWIKQKYEMKCYYKKNLPENSCSYGILLLDAVFNNDLNLLLPVLPLCNDDDLRTTVDIKDRRSALHIACSNASAIFSQLLVWYNVDIYALDDMGRSALWHAQTSGAHDCVSILIHAGLDPSYGTTPSSNECNNVANCGPTRFIIGSTANREFCRPSDVLRNCDAKLRRNTDKSCIVSRTSSSQLVEPDDCARQRSQSALMNGFHKRASNAFESLPASII